MSDLNEPEELPMGLMMQLGMNVDAMTTFSNLSESEKERMVQYIKTGVTGDDVKNRIAEVMNALQQHQGFF